MNIRDFGCNGNIKALIDKNYQMHHIYKELKNANKRGRQIIRS